MLPRTGAGSRSLRIASEVHNDPRRRPPANKTKSPQDHDPVILRLSWAVHIIREYRSFSSSHKEIILRVIVLRGIRF